MSQLANLTTRGSFQWSYIFMGSWSDFREYLSQRMLEKYTGNHSGYFGR